MGAVCGSGALCFGGPLGISSEQSRWARAESGEAKREGAGDGRLQEWEATPRLLSFHRRSYLLSSFDTTDSVKFQFSVKYAVWPFEAKNAPPTSSLEGFYFGYTQLAIWDAYDFSDSSPMKDVNFEPEVFYLYGMATPLDPGCRVYVVQVGAQHVSNGKREPETRAVNWLVGKARLGCSLARKRGPFGRAPHASVEVTAWTPPIRPVENPNIVDYVGYGRLQLSLKSGVWSETPSDVAPAGSFESSVALQVGAVGHVSVNWEGAYRPPRPSQWRFMPYLMVQYFNGYSETLLTYDERTREFRVGLGFFDTEPH